MTRSRLFITGLLSFVGCVALSVPAMAADDSRMGGKNQGTQQEKEKDAFQQQRSDKTQQGQDMINKQPMSSQQSDKSKSDCSSVSAVAGCSYPSEASLPAAKPAIPARIFQGDGIVIWDRTKVRIASLPRRT